MTNNINDVIWWLTRRLVAVCTDVDGGLQRTPLVTNSPSASVSQGLMSPPVSTHCKHSMAVAAIDAVQVAVIGPASAAESGIILLCFLVFLSVSSDLFLMRAISD